MPPITNIANTSFWGKGRTLNVKLVNGDILLIVFLGQLQTLNPAVYITPPSSHHCQDLLILLMLRALDGELKVQVTLGHFSIILSGHSFVNLNVTFQSFTTKRI